MFSHYKSIFGGVLLLILPFLIEPGLNDEIRIPKVKAIIFCAGLLGVCFIYRNIRPSLACAFGVGLFSAVFTGLGPSYQLNALIVLSSAIALSSFVAYSREREISRVLGFLVIAGVLQAVMGYMQMADFDKIFYYAPNVIRTIPVGFLGQQTLYGPFMAACVVAALFRRNYFSATFILVPCAVTHSSFTMAALFAGLVVVMYFELGFSAALLMLTIAAIVIGGIYYANPYHDIFRPDGRYENWRWIWSACLEKPWFGWGFGTYPFHALHLQSRELMEKYNIYQQAHSDLLQHFFDTGIVGISTIAYMLWDLAKRAFENRSNRMVMAAFGVFVVYFVNSLGNFPFRLSPQGLIALFAWVMVTTFKPEYNFDDRMEARG